jgi:RNA 2',3'-cyclic 3'-phosphodiesterase
MRLFTAIDLPAAITDKLSALVGRLRPEAKIQWSAAGNLHITTKFIGEWPEPRLGEITEVLRSLAGCDPIPIAVRGLGWFPNARAPRVFWAGVEAGEPLAGLARATDEAVAGIGVARESRPYSPHLTLARIKEPVPLERLRAAVGGLASTEFGSLVADRFCLYRSERKPTGSVYTKIEEFPLTR